MSRTLTFKEAEALQRDLMQVPIEYAKELGGSIQKGALKGGSYTLQRAIVCLGLNIASYFVCVLAVYLVWLHPKRKWYHILQFFYAQPLYGLMYFGWVWINDYVKLFKGLYGEKIERTAFEWRMFTAGKVHHALLMVMIPLWITDYDWSVSLLWYASMSFSCGWSIANVFQLAHVIDVVDHQERYDRNNQAYFAIIQIEHSANFATENKILGYFLGGLNYQIDHHL